ncbi:proton-conducting transporter transmembrane domain-containing protein [Spirochaeta dissipatitropha]
MIRLFPFLMHMPAGIEYAVLILFLFIGAVNVLNLILAGRAGMLPLALLHIFGGVLAVFAADLVSLLLSWELLTVSAFFLIRQSGSVSSRQASIRYIAIQMVSAALFFIATVLQFQETGSLSIVPLSGSSQYFMLAAVVIKTAAIPLHFWLVESYPAAIPEITALLSGFATKVGVLSAFRLLRVDMFGFPVLALIGAASAVTAVLFALLQTNARKLLSYHIVSQIGFMTAAVGMAVFVEAELLEIVLAAALFHMITYTLTKSLLILSAGAAERSFGHGNLFAMGGLFRRRPVLFFCTLVGSAAIAGFPFTSGFASKVLIKQGTDYGMISRLLDIASVGTALSFTKFMYLIFFNRSKSTEPLRQTRPNKGPVPEYVRMLPLLLLTLSTLLIGFLPGIVPGIADFNIYSTSTVIDALKTIAAAAVLWLLLKNFLTSGAKKGPEDTLYQGTRLQTPITTWLNHGLWPLRHSLRFIHAVGPQAQMKIMLLSLCAVILLLL